MKKIALWLSTTLLVATTMLGQIRAQHDLQHRTQATTRAEEPFTGFGYAEKNPTNPTGIGIKKDNLVYTAMIQLPSMKGNSIKGLTFQAFAPDSNGRVHILDASKKIIKTYKVNIVDGRNSVTFDTPYQITSDERLFIGYEMMGGTVASEKCFAIGYDKSTYEIKDATYLYAQKKYHDDGTVINMFNTKGMKLGSLLIFADIADSAVSLNKQLYVIDVKQPTSDLDPNSEFTTDLTVRNLSEQAVSKLHLNNQVSIFGNYQSDLDIDIKANETKSFKATVTVPETGIGTIHYNIETADDVKQHLARIETTYKVKNSPDGNDRHNILIERFTTEKCGNCPPADRPQDKMIEKLRKENIEVSFIAHHAGYYTDFLTLKESEALLDYLFPTWYPWAPAFSLNRVAFRNQSHDGEVEMAPVGKITDCPTVLNKKCGIALKKTDVKIDDAHITLKVDGIYITGTIDPEYTYITAVVTEDGIKAQGQAGGGSNYIHNGVARAFLTPAFGQLIEAKTDGTFSATINQDVDLSKIVKENAHLVFFIHQKVNNINPEEREVYFAKTLPFKTGTGIEEVNEANRPTLYVENGYIVFTGDVEQVTIYNAAGQLLSNRVDTQLPAGLYIVKATNLSGVYTYKVNVQ